MDMMDTVNTALAGWISGDIVAERRDEGNSERSVVFRNENGYSLARGFAIGERALVSMDLTDKTADEVIAHLLAGK